MRVRLCQFRTGYVNQMFTNPYACTICAICTVFCRAVKYRTYRTYRTWVSLRSIRLRLCCDKSQKLRVSNAFCLHRKAVWIFYSSVQLDSTIDLLKKDFNPRSPRGERRLRLRGHRMRNHFNPRSPRGERLLLSCLFRFLRDFNPRSPRGERR